MTSPHLSAIVQMTDADAAEAVGVRDFASKSKMPFVSVDLGEFSVFVANLDTLHAIQDAFDKAEQLILAAAEKS